MLGRRAPRGASTLRCVRARGVGCLAVGVALVVASTSSALPQQSAPTDGAALLRNGGGQSARYTGIGQLDGARTCTAWLLATVQNGPAYAIANGRCVSPSATATIVGRRVSGMTLEFGRFVDTPGARLRVGVRRIAWSSAKGMDLTLLELDRPVSALTARGIRPLRIAPSVPGAGRRVESVGIPVAGLEPDERMLRRTRCETRPRVSRLVEGGWLWYAVVASNCRGISAGSFGSPLLDRSSGSVVGVINTTALRGATLPACYLGRPCEVRGGVSLRPRRDTTYAIPIAGLRSCFTQSGRFRVGGPCPLDRRGWLTAVAPSVGVNPDVPDPITRFPQTTWDVGLEGRRGLTHYQTKVGEIGMTDCRTSEGYSAPLVLEDAPTYDAPLPREGGRYVLCIVAGPTPQYDQAWQPYGKATTVVRYIDRTRPTRRMRVRVSERPGSSFLEPVFGLPEHAYFEIKAGPAVSTLCTDAAGYRPYTRVAFRIPARMYPARACIRGWDEAGNESINIWERPIDGER
jgi:hypothetical protein